MSGNAVYFYYDSILTPHEHTFQQEEYTPKGYCPQRSRSELGCRNSSKK